MNVMVGRSIGSVRFGSVGLMCCRWMDSSILPSIRFDSVRHFTQCTLYVHLTDSTRLDLT